MKHVILKVSEVERTVIAAALMQYGFTDIAAKVSIPSADAADDGPEVKILHSEAPATVTHFTSADFFRPTPSATPTHVNLHANGLEPK